MVVGFDAIVSVVWNLGLGLDTNAGIVGDELGLG